MAEDNAIAQYRIYKLAEYERIASVNAKRIKSYPAAISILSEKWFCSP